MKSILQCCCLVFAGVAICCASPVRAETPAIAVVLKAPKSLTYEQIVPVLKTLKQMAITEIEYAFEPGDRISVEVKLREDINFARLDLTERRLKEAGVDDVSFSKVAVFPWTPFSIDEFEKAAQQGQATLLFVRADWSLSSRKLTREIFEHADVIRAAKNAEVIAFRVDLTHKPAEEVTKYLRQMAALPPTIVVHPAGKDSKPIRLRPDTTKQQFLKVLETLPKREAAKDESTQP